MKPDTKRAAILAKGEKVVAKIQAAKLLQETVTKSTLHKRGYKPQPGERTLEGYFSNAAKQKEIGLNTNSSGFDITGPKQFKRFGADSHGGIAPHVHQPIRNVTPKGPRGTT